MVLGRTRVKTPPAFPRAVSSQPGDWRISAGHPLFEGNCDLFGAFPGYIERGARLENSKLTVYEHGMAVDEGRPTGFYLAFDRIIATDECQSELNDEQVIRIRYQEGIETRMFSIRPRTPRLMLRTGGNRQSSRLLGVLHDQGVPGGPVDDVPVDGFLTHWGETDSFGSEAMVWHGHASASTLLSGDATPCDVFITSRSLVWGRDARSPISRVPIAAIRDVTPGHAGDRGHVPAAFIGIGDSAFDRVEFAFIFDSYESNDRNALERSAFIVHLRSRNVALSHPTAPDLPWMRASKPDPAPSPIWPSTVTAIRGQNDFPRPVAFQSNDPSIDVPRVPNFRDPAERLRPDRGVMTVHDWSSPGDAVPVWPASISRFDRSDNARTEALSVSEEDRLLSEFSPPESPVHERAESIVLPQPVDDPIRAYEAEALSSLDEVLAVVRRRESGEKQAHVSRRPPSGAALTAALAEVMERAGFDSTTAAVRRHRLLALDDAARRLDVLLPLHANGAISIRELRDRADTLCTELNAALFAGSS